MEKEKQITPQDWILWAAVKFSESWWFGKAIWWAVIIILVLQLSWLSVWTITDKWFGLKEAELSRSYELQIRQLELTEKQIIPKLDDILHRLKNVEWRVKSLEERVSDHDRRLDKLEARKR